MSYREGSNWNGPYYRRILILLAVGVVIAAGVVVALTSKSKLAAFHESPGCTNTRHHQAIHRDRAKGAEAVRQGTTPAAAPSTGTPSTSDDATPTDDPTPTDSPTPSDSASTTSAEPSADP